METIQNITLYAGAVIVCAAAFLGAIASVFLACHYLWWKLRRATKDFRGILKARKQYMQFVRLYNNREISTYIDEKMGAISLQHCGKCNSIKACKFRCYKSDNSGMVVDFVECDCEVKLWKIGKKKYIPWLEISTELNLK